MQVCLLCFRGFLVVEASKFGLVNGKQLFALILGQCLHLINNSHVERLDNIILHLKTALHPLVQHVHSQVSLEVRALHLVLELLVGKHQAAQVVLHYLVVQRFSFVDQ